jgi:predicted acylesterase/phospholipase RssA
MKASDHDHDSFPDASPRMRGDALILAGGVAKGAFAAGAVNALAQRTPLRVRRIVATSAGALTAVFLASAVRDGRDLGVAASELVGLWRSKATAADSFDLSPGALATRTGLSTNRKLLALLRKYVRPARGRRPVELRLVLTNSSGEACDVGDGEATTFEHVARYSGSAFDTQEGLEAVFRAACASSAFPVAFQPVEIPIRGKNVPCFDGGLVDNAPVKLAVDDPFVSRVFVIVPYPPVYQAPARLQGGALLIHLAEIVIQERYPALRVIRRRGSDAARVGRPLDSGRNRAPDNDDRSISGPVRLIARCPHGSTGRASPRYGRQAVAHQVRRSRTSAPVVGSRGNAAAVGGIPSRTSRVSGLPPSRRLAE